MTDGFSLITASSSARGRVGEFLLFSPFFHFPFPLFSLSLFLPAGLTYEHTRKAGGLKVPLEWAQQQQQYGFYWRRQRPERGRERQQTESSLLAEYCYRSVHSVCLRTLCAAMCAGLMYAGGRWCCSPWISYICPAGARPKPRPSYVPTIIL